MKQKTRILIYILIAAAFVILGSIAIISNHSADVPVSAQEHIDLGRIYLVDLSYEKASLEFTEAIEIEPLNADAYLGLAEAYVGMGDTEKAAQVLENGYEKTGDERLKAMLEKLTLLASEGAVTTIASSTETAISAAEEEQKNKNNEMVDLYIPYKFSQYYSNGTEYTNPYFSIYYDNYYVFGHYNETKTENTTSGLCDNASFQATNYCQAQKNCGILNADNNNILRYFNESYGYYCIYDSNYGRNHINISRNLPACIYDEENNLLTLTESEYNDDNQEIERRVYDKNGELEYKYKYEYDTNKRLIKEYYNENLSYEYKYDENGNLINILDYYEYNGITKATYTYDKHNNLIKYEDLINTISEEDSSFNSYVETIIVVEYKYNENGKLIEENWSYKNDAAKYLDNGNIYDEYGNCIKQYFYGIGDSNGLHRLEQPNERYYSYVYDNEGNIISTKTWNDDNVSYTKYSYQYENGKIIKEVEEWMSSSGDIRSYTELFYYNSDGKISKIEKESSFVEYTYDSHGNIIKEQECSSNGNILNSTEIEYIRIAVPKHIVDEMEKQYNIELNH